MLFVGGDEEHVARVELGSLLAGDKVAATSHHDINLIAGVRLLRIFPARGVELDAERAVLKQFGEALALWPGKLRKSFCNSDGVNFRRGHALNCPTREGFLADGSHSSDAQSPRRALSC